MLNGANSKSSDTVVYGAQGSIHLRDLHQSYSNARSTYTRVRTQNAHHTGNDRTEVDFITLISLICNFYRDLDNDLIPVQQFHPDAERYEDRGHTCIVSQRAISKPAASNYQRGATRTLAEDIVIKRTRESVLETHSKGLKSLINELLIRTHPPIRAHPNIVRFEGIAWDFEDEEANKPRPLLLEELAPQRSLERFWLDYNFMRMTFQSKMEICLDIANGLAILHSCRIAHGDVKPANILMFPRVGHQDAFMAKLTDFGHSVPANQGLKYVPAYTQEWRAPEVDTELEFDGMVSTDVYSFGLVILSIMLGRPFHDFEALSAYDELKKNGAMLQSAMEVVDEVDRKSNDSDLEMDSIQHLLRATIRLQPKARSLRRCTRLIHRYLSARDTSSRLYTALQTDGHNAELKGLVVEETVSVGYQSLALCSHKLKERILKELQVIAKNDADPRQHIAAWELSICYFSGFGTPQNFTQCSHWLSVAAANGIPAARIFRPQLLEAMNMGTEPTIVEIVQTERLHTMPEETVPIQQVDDRAWPTDTRRDTVPPRTELDSPSNKSDEPYVSDHCFETESEIQSDCEENLADGHASILSPEMISAARTGDVQRLSALTTATPECLNYKDSQGNILLIIAAQNQKLGALRWLLSFERVDASLHNNRQETVLHYMPKFDQKTVEELVPLLIQKGADMYREALPMDFGHELLHSASVRCCSVLQAILNDRLDILAKLLKGAHNPGSRNACRICEGGSRLKRIIAIALSTFRADALKMVVAHTKAHQPGEPLDLSKVEVWVDKKLLPLWRVPFRSVIIQTIDIPESFYRAITYGQNQSNALNSTISFLLENVAKSPDSLYLFLQEAVKVNSLDAVIFILQEAGRRNLPSSWWLDYSTYPRFSHNPLILAIKHGLREVFQCLCRSNQTIFRNHLEVNEIVSPSPIAKLFSKIRLDTNTEVGPETTPKAENGGQYTKRHYANLTQVCLSVAVMAAHQDQYFVNFILNEADPKYINMQPGHMDHQIIDEPAGVLAQAILTSSFGAATTISKKHPETWKHRVRFRYFYMRRSDHIAKIGIARWCPDEYVELRGSMKHVMLDNVIHKLTGEFWTIRTPTLPEYVLLVGSYSHCRFVLQHLHHERSLRRSSSSGAHIASSQAEAGILNGWERCKLTSKEF